MFITIHQPEFMPWSAFFEKMLRTDHFVILDSVQFQKNYFINRCRVRQNGQANWLTVPVANSSHEESIAEKRIGTVSNWGKKCFHTLYYNYRPAPFWQAHEEFLDRIFIQTKWERLLDLNMAVLSYAARQLEAPFAHTLSSTLDPTGKASDLILDICTKMGADHYLSGAHGADYLDDDAFARAGIRVTYQDYAEQPYAQHEGRHLCPLSIIDMLLILGPGARAAIEAGRRG